MVLLCEQVEVGDIVDLVVCWIGIFVQWLLVGEWCKFLDFDVYFVEWVIGQGEVVLVVVVVICWVRVGMKDFC